MKKILPILLLMSLFASCSSKEKKAQNLIENYMFTNLIDYSSYEAIETTIDSAFRSIYKDSTIRSHAITGYAALSLTKEALEKYEDANEYAMIYLGSRSYSGQRKYDEYHQASVAELEKAQTYLKVWKEADSLIRLLSKDFTNDFIGWEVKHRFRSKNRGGNYSIGDYVFVMDPQFKKIIYQEDADDEDMSGIIGIINDAVKEE